MKKQQKENEEIAKIIEREQIISYKKKPSNKLAKDSDEEIESANSLKSGVFSEDSEARFSKKNTPLPELYKDKKRIFHIQRNIPSLEAKQVNNYLEKEVRQHDNLVLKQKNNHLTSENMKLKTKVMTLEKQIAKLEKNYEEDPQKPKQPVLFQKDNKFKGSELLSLKMTIKNLRKELDEQKKQNEKIKWSIKFTRISELQCERDEILNETTRLRLMLQEEQMRKMTQKAREQGLSNVEAKLQSLTDKNLILSKQNAQLHKRIKSLEQGTKKVKQISQNEKNLSKMLFNAKRLIKQKQKQIQNLKVLSTATEVKIETTASINVNPRSQKQLNRPNESSRSKEKRIMSKSAQKYRKKPQDVQETVSNPQCASCSKHKETIAALEKKIQELSTALKQQKESNSKFGNMGEFSREEIDVASAEESEKLGRFLVFRFKAHHLTFQEAQKYLINGQISETTKKESLSVMEIAQSLVAEPFSVLSTRYLEVCLLRLFYREQCERNKTGQKIRIDENKKLTKQQILHNFEKMVQTYQIMPQEKEEQMFIQIAQLVTNYHQHILTALNRKRNGEGTIEQKELTSFFEQIELEKQFVDFITCQIILESLDLEHLNFYTMFQIFYMPPQGQAGAPAAAEPNQPNKKKFQVDYSQIVKEEDEEYEQSKSHIDAKQKTQSKREDDLDEYDEEEENAHSPSQKSERRKKEQESMESQKAESRQKRNMSMKNVQTRVEREKEVEKLSPKQANEDEDYEQLFQQQKMDHLPEEQKANEEKAEQELKPYVMEEVEDEYKEEFEN